MCSGGVPSEVALCAVDWTITEIEPKAIGSAEYVVLRAVAAVPGDAGFVLHFTGAAHTNADGQYPDFNPVWVLVIRWGRMNQQSF